MAGIHSESKERSEAVLHVAPSPHFASTSMNTRSMMMDVVVALIPILLISLYLFHWLAVVQLAICIVSCVITESMFQKMRGRAISIGDFSALVSGIIIAMSLPATAPWYVGVIASVVAMGIGKAVFGGLGMNIFNPAMVGRAFVMIAFAGSLAASGYENAISPVDAITRATPMDAFKQTGQVTGLWELFWGMTNGSLGETSAFASIIGGVYLCIRRTAAWQIPVGVIGATVVLGGMAQIFSVDSGWTLWHHLFGGSLLFGAFFIATDPVSSPLTPKGRFVFGLGVGALIMLLRLFSGYPEGTMFAVLLMNAVTPLINRWTIPTPFGG